MRIKDGSTPSQWQRFGKTGAKVQNFVICVWKSADCFQANSGRQRLVWKDYKLNPRFGTSYNGQYIRLIHVLSQFDSECSN